MNLREVAEKLYWDIVNNADDPERSEAQIDWVVEYLQENLGAKPTRETLLKMLEGKDKTLENRSARIKELQREVNGLKKQLGIQEDGFIDTPSLNVIRFKPVNGFIDMRPHCSEHGAMKCYDHKIYRCVECGPAVCLENVMVLPLTGLIQVPLGAQKP